MTMMIMIIMIIKYDDDNYIRILINNKTCMCLNLEQMWLIQSELFLNPILDWTPPKHI